MTGTAIILCRDMINYLWGCNTSVMAGGTVVLIYTQVVKAYARKAGKVVAVGGGVTIRTIQYRRQVIQRFSGTDLTVMARDAVIHDSCMIKGCWYKARGQVAVSAITVGWQVINEFANSYYIVVAICT